MRSRAPFGFATPPAAPACMYARAPARCDWHTRTGSASHHPARSPSSVSSARTKKQPRQHWQKSSAPAQLKIPLFPLRSRSFFQRHVFLFSFTWFCRLARPIPLACLPSHASAPPPLTCSLRLSFTRLLFHRTLLPPASPSRSARSAAHSPAFHRTPPALSLSAAPPPIHSCALVSIARTPSPCSYARSAAP